MDATELLNLVAGGESLGLEFKSDRQRLSDRAIVEATACLANGPGGALLLGIEDWDQTRVHGPKHSGRKRNWHPVRDVPHRVHHGP